LEISFWMISVYIWDKKALHQKQQCWSLLQLGVSEKMRCGSGGWPVVSAFPAHGWIGCGIWPFWKWMVGRWSGFLLGVKILRPIFRCELAVSFREGMQKIHQNIKSSISIVFLEQNHMYIYIYIHIYLTWPSNVNGMAGWLCCICLGRLYKTYILILSEVCCQLRTSSECLNVIWDSPRGLCGSVAMRKGDWLVCVCLLLRLLFMSNFSHIGTAPKSGCF